MNDASMSNFVHASLQVNRMSAECHEERDALRAQLAAEQAAHEAALTAEAQLVEKLEAEQAAHKLDIEVFESGASTMAEQVTRLNERAKLAEAVRDSTLARLSEVVEAVKAERVARANDQNEATRDTFDALRDAVALTDAMVRKHEGAGVDDERDEATLMAKIEMVYTTDASNHLSTSQEAGVIKLEELEQRIAQLLKKAAIGERQHYRVAIFAMKHDEAKR